MTDQQANILYAFQKGMGEWQLECALIADVLWDHNHHDSAELCEGLRAACDEILAEFAEEPS